MTNHQSYKLGDTALNCDIEKLQSADFKYKRAASSLKVGDGAMILRSDGVWRCAIVTGFFRGTASCPPIIIFAVSVSADGSRKKIPCHRWGAMVRPLKKSAGQRHGKNTFAPDLVRDKRGVLSSLDTDGSWTSTTQTEGCQVNVHVKTASDIRTNIENDATLRQTNQRRKRRKPNSPLTMSHLIQRLVMAEEALLCNRDASEANQFTTVDHFIAPMPTKTKASKEELLFKNACTKLIKEMKTPGQLLD